MNKTHITTSLLIILTLVFCGCGAKPRQSVLRLVACGELKQIALSIEIYEGDYNAAPRDLDSLSSSGILTNEDLLGGYLLKPTPDGYIIYSKHIFPEVKKGEPWGGLGDEAREDIPAARAILIRGESAKTMPESEFAVLMENLATPQEGAKNDSNPE